MLPPACAVPFAIVIEASGTRQCFASSINPPATVGVRVLEAASISPWSTELIVDCPDDIPT